MYVVQPKRPEDNVICAPAVKQRIPFFDARRKRNNKDLRRLSRPASKAKLRKEM